MATVGIPRKSRSDGVLIGVVSPTVHERHPAADGAARAPTTATDCDMGAPMTDERPTTTGPAGSVPLPWYAAGGAPGATALSPPPAAPASVPVARPAASIQATAASQGAGPDLPAPMPAAAPPPPPSMPPAPVAAPPWEAASRPTAHTNNGAMTRTVALATIAAVLVAVVAAGVTWLVLDRRADEAPTTAAASSAPEVPSEAPAEAPSSDAGTVVEEPAPTAEPLRAADPEEDALLELSVLREDSLSDLVLDGRWVAQVASKSVGITDPLQIAQNGTRTFYATDILAEVESSFGVAPFSSILVLQSTDFGKYSVDARGQAFWVTLIDTGFASSADVDAWCATIFADLSSAQRENTCAPRTLVPSHG